MTKRILDMVEKKSESELKKVNIYVDFDCFFKTKKYFSIAILEYKNIFKTIYYLSPKDTPRASMINIMTQSLKELKKDCLVNIYPRKSFGLKSINSRYESGVAPLKNPNSSIIIELINIMRTSGHIVKINLDNDLFVKKTKELNLDKKFDKAKTVIKNNNKEKNHSLLSLVNPECVNKIYDFYVNDCNNDIFNEDKLIELSSKGQDKLSPLKLNNLKEFVSEEEYQVILKKFKSDRNREQVIRWICRGLTLDLAINKVYLMQKKYYCK